MKRVVFFLIISTLFFSCRVCDPPKQPTINDVRIAILRSGTGEDLLAGIPVGRDSVKLIPQCGSPEMWQGVITEETISGKGKVHVLNLELLTKDDEGKYCNELFIRLAGDEVDTMKYEVVRLGGGDPCITSYIAQIVFNGKVYLDDVDVVVIEK